MKHIKITVTVVAGLAVLMLALSFTRPRPVVYSIGDSTMATKTDSAVTPERGWMQAFTNIYGDRIEIHNHAKNGRSTKSFIDEGLWAEVEGDLKAGDYVFIQFGHNDQKKNDTTRWTSPYDFGENLKFYIGRTRAKGAIPVLFTPIARRHFDDNGELKRVHRGYSSTVKEVAAEQGVYLVDLEAVSRKMILDAGEEGSKGMFMWLDAGQCGKHPDGLKDNTHLNIEGADKMARAAAEEIAKEVNGLKKYLR